MTTPLNATAHPLLTRLRADYTAVQRYKPLAEKILAAHHAHGVSDQSIIRAADGHLVGPAEDHRHRLGEHGYLAVTGRTKVADLARDLATIAEPDKFGGSFARAVELHAAAEAAAPMAAAILAVTVQAGGIEWDTGETVADAGRRLALDAAWAALPQPNPAAPNADDIAALVMDVIGVVRGPVATYAAAYLERRELIAAWLTENDVEWGGTLLDAARAAARARVTPSTWRAYVARSQAPAGDHDGQWRPATIDAWMTTRPRVRH